jgi:hypothetical protein
MAEGGFLIKFDGKEIKRCYCCKFDYDGFLYEINDMDKNSLPESIKKIEIIVES